MGFLLRKTAHNITPAPLSLRLAQGGVMLWVSFCGSARGSTVCVGLCCIADLRAQRCMKGQDPSLCMLAARSKVPAHAGVSGVGHLMWSSPATIQVQLTAPPWEAKPGLRPSILSCFPQTAPWTMAQQEGAEGTSRREAGEPRIASLTKLPGPAAEGEEAPLPPLPPSRMGILQPGKHRMLMKQAWQIGQPGRRQELQAAPSI